MTIIIPSLNRALQLDCLLNSIKRYWDVKELNICVLYKHTSAEYEEAYYKLFEKHPYVNPVLEYDFGKQIKDFINKSDDVVGFFTDDSVMYSMPDIHPIQIKGLFRNEKVISFSLRLGLNTTVQDYLSNQLQPKLDYKEDNNLIFWRWSRYPSYYNYSYIFSWDGHFYSKTWLYNLVKEKSFESPRALEHQLSIDNNLRDLDKPYMVACKKSSVFVNTINCVQPGGPMAGVYHSYDINFLNRKFLDGYEIDLNSFNKDIYGCHSELPISFIKWG